VIPKIINRPETASTDVPEQIRPATTAPRTEQTSEASKAPASKPATKETEQQQSPPKVSTEPESTPISVNLLSVVRSPTLGVVAFGALALVLLAAFAFARRREHVATTPARDIASVSLDDQRGRGQLVPRPGVAHGGSATSPSSPPPVPRATGHGDPAWVNRIPQTRAEALQMLGMGVSADATETAMKRIVDGLRLSWHPDLAKDEADRQLREFRVKQINAAWDLIQGKRMERLDS
jgi:hypothetical protein